MDKDETLIDYILFYLLYYNKFILLTCSITRYLGYLWKQTVLHLYQNCSYMILRRIYVSNKEIETRRSGRHIDDASRYLDGIFSIDNPESETCISALRLISNFCKTFRKIF